MLVVLLAITYCFVILLFAGVIICIFITTYFQVILYHLTYKNLTTVYFFFPFLAFVFGCHYTWYIYIFAHLHMYIYSHITYIFTSVLKPIIHCLHFCLQSQLCFNNIKIIYKTGTHVFIISGALHFFV